MSTTTARPVLTDIFGPTEGTNLRIKQAVLVVLGIAALAIAAKIRIPMWPVPLTMTTFAVLTIGTAYGARLGLITKEVERVAERERFAGTDATNNGLAYMMGGTGGYLVGYAMAAGALGYLASRGWDRTRGKMALALLIGNAIIYVPGLLWLGVLYGWDKPILEWGLTPFPGCLESGRLGARLTSPDTMMKRRSERGGVLSWNHPCGSGLDWHLRHKEKPRPCCPKHSTKP